MLWPSVPQSCTCLGQPEHGIHGASISLRKAAGEGDDTACSSHGVPRPRPQTLNPTSCPKPHWELVAGARLRQWAHVEEGQELPEGFDGLQEWRDFEVPFKGSLMQVRADSVAGPCTAVRWTWLPTVCCQRMC